MRSFWCAPWKRVRIFEGILGVFQDAHFSKPVRIFEQRAHLRSRAGPCTPAPFSRKVAQALAAASIPLFEEVSHSSRPLILALRRLRRFVSRREGPAGKEKSRAWIVDPDTAPLMRDLQLVAVPYFVVR
jgi:hypothetical protein